MRTTVRTVAVLLAAGAALLAFTPMAAAHVTVTADDPEPGHAAKAVFRVPDERDDASTVRLEVTFPDDHPLGRVTVEPVPGWTATVANRTLTTPIHTHDGEITETTSSITWQGGQIKPGEFVEFPVSISLPHEADRLVFKAVQSYSDGSVVRWIEVPEAGAPEPEHPAPVLSLTTHVTQPPMQPVDWLARVAGFTGLAAALAALAAVVLLAGRRRVTRPPADAPRAADREKARI